MVNQHIEIMGWESSGVVGFDLGPLVQGQMRTAKGNLCDGIVSDINPKCP